MFAVYNNGSVKFRSTSDNLYDIDTVDEGAASRHKPDDDLYINFQDILNNKEKNKSNGDSLKEYKKVANMDTTEEVYHVRDIMTSETITINFKASVKEAYELLKEKQVSHIPVVTDFEEIVGMINKKIILNLLLESGDINSFMRQTLNSLEFPQLITTDPISDIRRVAKVMLSYRLDAVPVVNSNNVLVGIVSKTDLIKAMSYIPQLRLWA